MNTGINIDTIMDISTDSDNKRKLDSSRDMNVSVKKSKNAEIKQSTQEDKYCTVIVQARDFGLEMELVRAGCGYFDNNGNYYRYQFSA
jgi:hypothetical protein